MHPRRWVALLLTALSLAVPEGRGRAADVSYTRIGEIPIGGAGRFDYLTVDGATRRLYVAHGTEVVVIDMTTDAVVGRIAGTPGVHGIAIAPGGRGFTSNGRENAVGIVDLATLRTIRKVPAGANPDAILYEPKRGEIYAFNHTGASATVIDAASGEVVTTIPLSGEAEMGRADPGLGRVYVNIEDRDAVDVVDVVTHAVVAHWPVAPASGPTGMAVDLANHRLFVGGGKFMVMMDATTGRVVAHAPICSGTDGTWFDPGTGLAFSPDGPDALRVVQTIATARGARTMTLDPATHRLYTAAPDYPPAAAQPRAGRRRPAPIPDTFRVLVYAPR